MADYGRAIATGNDGAKSFQETGHLTDGIIQIVPDLDARYSVMTLSEEKGISDVEEQLGILLEKITTWDSDESMIWDRDPKEASEYLQVVDEVRKLTKDLGGLQSKSEEGGNDELLHFAHSILQTAMTRLEEEFTHLLVQYQQPVEPERMSFRSTEEDFVDEFSSSSFDEVPIEGKIQGDNSSSSEEFVIDLIHPNAILDLKCIAEIMFMSNYDKECTQAYIALRKDALDECLSVLHMEKLSIEEVLRMDWSVLNSMIKRWNRAMKVFVRVYLASEKRLCNLVFGEISGSVESCFAEISKGSLLQLLNFGEAIAIGPLKPEKLFRILDMYEGLADLLGDVELLFPNDYGSSIITECHEVLWRLGESVKGTLAEFKNAIRSNTSTAPFSNGGVHPLTRYVMNYIRALAAYSETLNLLYEHQNGKDQYSFSEDDGEGGACSSPMVRHLQSVTSVLELNLEARSTLYRDGALQSFFLMNNICYMVQKVRDSDLRTFLGDDWIRAHNRKFRQHAMIYERVSWTLILSFLKDEGICNPGSNNPSKTVLKERLKNFNLAFEEVYRNQTAWLIPVVELRDDLRISISLKVLQAYRTFMGRYAGYLDGVRQRDKYIKYWPDDLEKCLLDLFEGLPKVLHYPNKRHLRKVSIDGVYA